MKRRGTQRRMQAVVLVLAMGVIAGCVHSGRGSAAAIRLPIRFHLIASPTSAALTTTRTDADARMLTAVANSIWHQAGIEWYVESVVREESTKGATYDSLLSGTLRPTDSNLVAWVPREHMLRDGWNVYLIRDFGRIAGGMFRPELRGAVLAERGFGFDLPAAGRGGATLAHELGHSLGLGHVPCDSTRDIMANACWSPQVTSSLTPAQISEARSQASRGRPVDHLVGP